VQQLRELEVLPEFWTQRLLRGRESVEGPPGGEQGRVAVFEMFSVTPELSAAIDRSASLQEMQETLDPGSFGTFVDYARFLMHEGIVAPERILETLPRGAARIRYDAGHHHGTAQHAPSYWSDKMSANPPTH
jgi:type II secretory ATPase GspE/PulE/Tfp pilus assembly ATPase PilB-like protein